MPITRYAEKPDIGKEWIESCKEICAAAGWKLIGTHEWDQQYLCHERTGKILLLEPNWSTEGCIWDGAVETIIDRSYRA